MGFFLVGLFLVGFAECSTSHMLFLHKQNTFVTLVLWSSPAQFVVHSVTNGRKSSGANDELNPKPDFLNIFLIFSGGFSRITACELYHKRTTTMDSAYILKLTLASMPTPSSPHIDKTRDT